MMTGHRGCHHNVSYVLGYARLLDVPCTAGGARGGAMNSGDIGSGTRRFRILSISLIVAASICQPSTSSIGSNCPGWRAPHSAIVGP